MRDSTLVVLWLIVLGTSISGAVAARRAGVPATYIRDALHIGACVWILGWPSWESPYWPIAFTLTAIVFVSLIPVAARWIPLARGFERSVTGGGERYQGLILYSLSFGIFTTLAFVHPDFLFPSAAALWVLALGDGIGGAVGRGLGQVRFKLFWAKSKTLEGTVTVLLISCISVLYAARWCGAEVSLPQVLVAGVVAATVEAFSPLSSDNLLVPASVFSLLALLPFVGQHF